MAGGLRLLSTNSQNNRRDKTHVIIPRTNQAQGTRRFQLSVPTVISARG